jgi:hypothetical protein
MPIGNERVRILEIDSHPYQIASEIEKILAPILDEQSAVGALLGITLKAGEFYDADYPTSHSSFFVLVRVPADSEPDAQSIIETIVAFCNKSRLPIIEIGPDHQEYEQSLAKLYSREMRDRRCPNSNSQNR